MWCIPKITEEFKTKMESAIDIYQKPYDPKKPVLCFDEKSKQLIKDSRKSVKAKKKKPRKVDYEYERNGTRNIFLTVEPKGGYRNAKVTKRRTKKDFAEEIKRIANLERYKDADKIHFVMDNLNTHFEKSLTETFSKTEAETILKRIEFHHTPKHASWMNMAEIELSILGRQCVNKRIPSEYLLKKNISAWQKSRNEKQSKINWKFTKEDARKVFKYKPANLS